MDQARNWEQREVVIGSNDPTQFGFTDDAEHAE